MAHSELAAELTAPRRSLNLRWVPPLFLRPNRTLRSVLSWESSSWATPMLLISLAALLLPIAVGPIARELAVANQPPLPPDFQYYSQPQQEQFLRALEVSTGPLYIYVLPASAALGRVWIGWLVSGFGLYLALTILGGRWTSRSLLTLAAWAGLPYALRELVRTGYTLLGGSLIQYPGLSGLVMNPDPTFPQHMLRHVDLYWLWHVGLLLVGLRSAKDLPAWKSWAAVVAVQIAALVLQTAPTALAGQLDSMNIIRPFYF